MNRILITPLLLMTLFLSACAGLSSTGAAHEDVVENSNESRLAAEYALARWVRQFENNQSAWRSSSLTEAQREAWDAWESVFDSYCPYEYKEYRVTHAEQQGEHLIVDMLILGESLAELDCRFDLVESESGFEIVGLHNRSLSDWDMQQLSPLIMPLLRSTGRQGSPLQWWQQAVEEGLQLSSLNSGLPSALTRDEKKRLSELILSQLTFVHFFDLDYPLIQSESLSRCRESSEADNLCAYLSARSADADFEQWLDRLQTSGLDDAWRHALLTEFAWAAGEMDLALSHAFMSLSYSGGAYRSTMLMFEVLCQLERFEQAMLLLQSFTETHGWEISAEHIQYYRIGDLAQSAAFQQW